MPDDAPTYALGICSKGCEADGSDEPLVESLTIEGYEVYCGFFRARTPVFDSAGAHRDSVLVETSAFSCNYRDKALILRMANMPLKGSFYPIGSEMCGRVARVGASVTGLAVGDMVIVDGYWASGPKPWGLPTNHASRTLQVLPSSKLMRVPAAMSEVEAASFSIGGQTSFAMVRRAGVTEGSRVLVTGGTSNTSLFLFHAARLAGGEVSVTTTSAGKVGQLHALGASNVFVIDPEGGPLAADEAMAGYVKDSGGFDVVLDPFADFYLRRAVSAMAVGGLYVSCGVERQFPPAGTPVSIDDDRALFGAGEFLTMMTRNLNIMGNCLGTTDDLSRAVAAWEQGTLPIAIDSVIESKPGEPMRGAGAFLSRTYLDHSRFGKVVYRYRMGA
jgi:NADPH:quinone reductase-like Zn-dependent oxidoreductase